MLEIFATKKVTASQLDEVGLSVLIKSCDRLGDAEWAVTILKEAIKAVSVSSTTNITYCLKHSDCSYYYAHCTSYNGYDTKDSFLQSIRIHVFAVMV